jgi:hypothetical protein
MVKPPLRTKSIGFKASEEEYAQLETAAQASRQTLGEWCREAILRGGASNVAAHDPALADLKESGLPLEKSLANFDGKRLPVKVSRQMKVLLEGGFLDRKENLLIFGNQNACE